MLPGSLPWLGSVSPKQPSSSPLAGDSENSCSYPGRICSTKPPGPPSASPPPTSPLSAGDTMSPQPNSAAGFPQGVTQLCSPQPGGASATWNPCQPHPCPSAQLTQPGQVSLLLLLGAIGVDGVHDQRGLDAHDRPVAAVHTLDLSCQQPICHVRGPCAAVAWEVGAGCGLGAPGGPVNLNAAKVRGTGRPPWLQPPCLLRCTDMKIPSQTHG